MTAQIGEYVLYRELNCNLVAHHGTGLFHPTHAGINAHTLCHNSRDHFCEYAVARGSLLLTRVYLGEWSRNIDPARRSESVQLFGKQARRLSSSFLVVDELSELVPFTGSMLLGDDLLQQFKSEISIIAYMHRTVFELVFEAGRLTEEHDRSPQMNQFRELLSSGELSSATDASRAEIKQWLTRNLTADYGQFWGFSLGPLVPLPPNKVNEN